MTNQSHLRFRNCRTCRHREELCRDRAAAAEGDALNSPTWRHCQVMPGTVWPAATARATQADAARRQQVESCTSSSPNR